MMRQLGLTLHLLFLLNLSSNSKDINNVIIQKNNFINTISYFNSTNKLSFDQVKNLPDHLFQNYTTQELKKDSVYWFKIILDNINTKNGEYYIHFNSMISNIELYELINDSTYLIKIGGSLVPFTQRSASGYLKDKISFTLQSGVKSVLYIRILNKLDHTYDLTNIGIISKIEYEEKILNLRFIQTCFLGMMIIIFVLNFILFIFSGDKLYMYYSLYTFLIAVFFFYNFQFSEKYLFYNNPRMDISLMWSVYIAQYIYLLFFLELLKNTNLPVSRKYVGYYAKLILALCIVILISGQIDYNIGIIISDFYTLLNVIFVVTSFVVFYSKVNRTTRIVLTGSFIMVIGALVTTLTSFSRISVYNIYYYQFGVLLELILFTIAVNYTYNKEHIEKVQILYKNSLLKLEKSQKEKENLELRNEIDIKNRALTSKAMLLSEKEALITGIIEQLSNINADYNGKTEIQNLINNLKINLSSGTWDELEFHFNETHPRFYSNLNSICSNLSANDRKLCAFLKLNLSSKEISAITGKNLNTIDVARSRLRKKMGLKEEENLQAVIANIET